MITPPPSASLPLCATTSRAALPLTPIRLLANPRILIEPLRGDLRGGGLRLGSYSGHRGGLLGRDLKTIFVLLRRIDHRALKIRHVHRWAEPR